MARKAKEHKKGLPKRTGKRKANGLTDRNAQRRARTKAARIAKESAAHKVNVQNGHTKWETVKAERAARRA
jgi:hypothetical protein